MKKTFAAMLVLFSVLGMSGSVEAAPILNGGFSPGLAGWTAAGDVSVTSTGEAALGDNDETYSSLYQGVALDPGLYTIEFDFRNLLSIDVPQGTFPDTFFASLYFANDLTQFDLKNSVFDDATALFDLDANGFFNSSGVIGASTIGDGWLHFSMNFQNDYGYAIPTFELFDMNFVNNDSTVLLDNVSITSSAPAPVPEPATLLLLGSGCMTLLAGNLRSRWKKRFTTT